MDIFLIAFLIRNTMEHVWGLNSLPVLLTNPSTYFEKPFKAADPAALFFLLLSARNDGRMIKENFIVYYFLFHQPRQDQATLWYHLNFVYRPQLSFLIYDA